MLAVVPLGESLVTRGGLLVSRGVSTGLLVSVSVSGLLLSKDAEEGQEECAKDEDEQAEDDGVLDGGGVEGEGGGAVGANRDEAEAGVAADLLLVVDGEGAGAGDQGESGENEHPLHDDGCVGVGTEGKDIGSKGVEIKRERERQKKREVQGR